MATINENPQSSISKSMDPRTLAKLFPSNDPLDNPDFDAVEWINKLFSNEESLENIDEEIEIIKKKINKIDEEIIFSVSQQSKIGTKGEEELQKSKESIQMLFYKIKEIREKAIESEKMVQEICKDIRDLDCAKQNLTTTITALTRLHSIVTQNERLNVMTEKKLYKEVQNLLGSVNNLFEYFEDYKNVPKLVQLQSETNNIKKRLKDQIFAEFGELEASKLGSALQNLSHACFVVNALGKGHREDFIKQFCDRQLAIYAKEFAPGTQYYKLDYVEQRYAWCMQLIRHYKEHYSSLYPPLWHVPEHLVISFCKKTRESLYTILNEEIKKKEDKKNPGPGIDYNLYKRALKTTLSFESELCILFPNADNIDKEEDELDTFEVPQLPINPDGNTSLKPTSKIFKGKISDAFDDFIFIFTAYHEREMKNFFDEAFKEETWTDTGGKRKNKVLQSSRDLVYLLAETRKQIKAMSQARPYFEIYLIFQKSLTNYAGRLKEKLDSLEGRGNKILSDDQVKQACVILNTSYYCSSTTKEIETSIKSDIDDVYKDRIISQPVVDIFEELIAKCLKLLVRNLSLKLTNDGSVSNFRSIITTNWVICETVGDQSDYINNVNNELYDLMTLFRNVIAEEHFTFLCDSVVKAVTKLFEDQINQIRGISEIGAEQLLVDATSLKGILAKLQQIGLSDEDAARVSKERFVKRIEKEMAPIEKLLKILMTPKEFLTATYKTMYHQSLNPEHFIKILNLKGIPKSEQGVFLDQFGLKPNDPLRQNIRNQSDEQPRKILDFDNVFKSIDFDNVFKKREF